MACLASHSVGKTFCAAIGVNWWYDTQEESIVYITAPSWDQCLGLTFKQVKRFRLMHDLPGVILDTGWVRDEDRLRATAHYIRAINAEKGEGFQGEHTAPMLLVFEEAVGVPVYIWEAATGLMTHPANRQLCIANPTNHATPFGAAVDSGEYHVLKISALEHPNIVAELAGRERPYPDAVPLLWVKEMLQTRCDVAEKPDADCFRWHSLKSLDAVLSGQPLPQPPDWVWYLPNADFQGRVLGEFPTQADEQVVPRAWLERGMGASGPTGIGDDDYLPQIGCDVARFGKDRTVIAARQGARALSVSVLRQMDNLQVTAALKETAQRLVSDLSLPREAVKAIPIHIDVTGGLGTGPYDILREEGYAVVEVNAGGLPLDREQFVNKRSELWWSTRERARTREIDLAPLPREMRERAVRELAAPRYKVDARGRKVVEPKEKTKEKLGYSPDIADALNLAYSSPGRWWQDAGVRDYLKSPPAREEPPREASAFIGALTSAARGG